MPREREEKELSIASKLLDWKLQVPDEKFNHEEIIEAYSEYSLLCCKRVQLMLIEFCLYVMKLQTL